MGTLLLSVFQTCPTDASERLNTFFVCFLGYGMYKRAKTQRKDSVWLSWNVLISIQKTMFFFCLIAFCRSGFLFWEPKPGDLVGLVFSRNILLVCLVLKRIAGWKLWKGFCFRIVLLKDFWLYLLTHTVVKTTIAWLSFFGFWAIFGLFWIRCKCSFGLLFFSCVILLTPTFIGSSVKSVYFFLWWFASSFPFGILFDFPNIPQKVPFQISK